MDRTGFKKWLEITLADKPTKLRRDILCRAGRVEKAFQEIDNSFSFEKEYKKDGGKAFTDKMRCYGRGLEGTGIKLPLHSNQMSPIVLAVKTYIKYLDSIEGKK